MEEMRGCPQNGVRQEQRQQRLEIERGAGRQQLGAGHGQGTGCPLILVAPGHQPAQPGQCGRWATRSGDNAGRAKHSLGNDFAGSAGGLEKIEEVWELAGVWRE